MRMPKEIFVTVLALLLFQGCTTTGRLETRTKAEVLSHGNEQIIRLEADLTTLLGYRDAETHRLAQTILTTTDTLARQYRVQPPALWHNFLVNVGIRERGLCCHWTQDLLRAIEALQLQKFDAVWAVSRHGTWREHNSVVIAATGQEEVKNGLVIDPWRNAGQLYWAFVAEDVYVWQRHPGENGVARIRCR